MNIKKGLVYLQWTVIFVLVLANIFLILQNIRLNERNKNYGPENYFGALVFEKKLKENFQFKTLPLFSNAEKYHFYKKTKNPKGYLIIVFDFTVCGKCLSEQLEILKNFKSNLQKKEISLLAIVGTSSKKENSDIINLYRTKKLFFPFRIISVKLLYLMFNLDKDKYIDTPFYLYTSDSFKVMDIFKPVLFKTKEFIQWIKTILN